MKTYKVVFTLVALTITFGSCSDDFLQEKRDMTGINEEVFQDPFLATAYVDFVYGLFLPPDGSASFVQHQVGARGQYNDNFSQTTEELGGQVEWNQPWASIAINQSHALQYFGERMQGGVQNNTWTRIRQINLFLDEVDKYGLPEELRNHLKGQLYFWRGFQYFELLRRYGGVPLVLTAQNPANDDGSNEVPRATSSATLEQVVADLDMAIELLPGRWANEEDWGRITSGGAAALKGRALLTWASPLFNRSDDQARWERSYQANSEAKRLLEENGFRLYEETSLEDAKAWEEMWFAQAGNPEAVIVYNFNSVSSDQTQRNNGWEGDARPRDVSGDGSISPTKQMLDAFPMADGKMPGDPTSLFTYDPQKFYKNRDPRFYKTFAYNGSLWPYANDPAYRLWTYSWFTNETAETPNSSTEARGTNATGIYVRKATNPEANDASGFEYSTTDFMELRFAEVVLNLAESAIGIGLLSEGLEGIKEIRRRAGIDAGSDGNYGLGAAAGDRDRLFAAVLNERKIEFAYEGKRFWDLRRWMLFNDDFGTCSRLGVEPLHGTRRTGIWIYVKESDGSKYVGNDDPMIRNTAGDFPVVDRQPATYPVGVESFEEYLDYLYDNHFVVIEKDNVDPTNPADWTFTWFNEYYFFGLHQSILMTSPYLEQTQGWPDLNGGMGTFDPLQ